MQWDWLLTLRLHCFPPLIIAGCKQIFYVVQEWDTVQWDLVLFFFLKKGLLHEKPKGLYKKNHTKILLRLVDKIFRQNMNKNKAIHYQVSQTSSSRWAFWSCTMNITVLPYTHQKMPIFHWRKQCQKGWPKTNKRKSPQSYYHNSEDKCNWINPVLPNCTIWYLKISYFTFHRKFWIIVHSNRFKQLTKLWEQKNDEALI